MSEPVLQVKGLKTYYYTEEGVVPAVDGLDFEVEPGETFAIVGESGCGKSVTSLSILRLIPSPPGKIIDGEIIYHGQDLVKKSEREMRSIRGNDISMIFQEPMTSLNPVFTVGQQMANRSVSISRWARRKCSKSPSKCCGSSASRSRNTSSTIIQTSSPAVCASAL